jgi:5'-3' exonuclease
MVTWPMIEFEADDAIATAAARFCDEPSLEKIVICSPDKDLTQCVRGERVVTSDRQRGVTLDESGVVAKFGVPPQSIPDYLALVGDTADGIPGVPRWGARSAATVLARYGHLESIPAQARDWDVKVRGAVALASGLSAMREEAVLYRTLATLRVDVPLTESLSDLEWRGVKQPDFDDLCRELADPALAERVPRWLGGGRATLGRAHEGFDPLKSRRFPLVARRGRANRPEPPVGGPRAAARHRERERSRGEAPGDRAGARAR